MKNRNKGTNKKGRNWIKEKQIQIKREDWNEWFFAPPKFFGLLRKQTKSILTFFIDLKSNYSLFPR